MTTPRERREQRAAADRRQALPGEVARRAIVPIVIVLALGGVAALVFLSEEASGDCPVHWHATFGIFIEGGRVPFPQPPYTITNEGGTLPLAMHMHQPDQETLHIEPGRPRCRGVEATMAMLDVDLERDRLVLEGAHDNGPYGGTYTPSGNDTLTVHIQMAGEEARQEAIRDILSYQLKDGEKMVIAFGAYADEDYQAMLDMLAWPPKFDENGKRAGA